MTVSRWLEIWSYVNVCIKVAMMPWSVMLGLQHQHVHLWIHTDWCIMREEINQSSWIRHLLSCVKKSTTLPGNVMYYYVWSNQPLFLEKFRIICEEINHSSWKCYVLLCVKQSTTIPGKVSYYMWRNQPLFLEKLCIIMCEEINHCS